MTRSLLSAPIGLLLLLGGCASTPPMGAPPTGVSAAAADYLIGVDDVVAVRIWKNPDLDVTGPVRSDGKITVPLIGDVQAGGLTPETIAADVSASISKFVREPQVTVMVTELRSHEYLSRVRVTGAVRTPVSLPYRQGMTVLDAVLAAGGPTDFAASDRTALHRRGTDSTQRYGVALGSMLEDGDLSSNYPVQPGDVISVPQRNF